MNPEVIAWFQEYWPEAVILISLIPAISIVIKVIMNLIPSKKNRQLFIWLDRLLNWLVPNLARGGKIKIKKHENI